MLINLIITIILVIINVKIVESIICKPGNQFVQVVAPPGVGKTTLAADITRKAKIENKKVYSNVPIITANRFKIDDLGKKELKDCIIIIDESGAELQNRDWRNNLTKKQIKFIKKHRHYNIDFYLFSQAYNDTDNKFRELTTKLIILEKSKIPFFIILKVARKKIDIIDGKILDIYYWSKYETSRVFIVKAWAYFNSWDKTENLEKKSDFIYTKSAIYDHDFV